MTNDSKHYGHDAGEWFYGCDACNPVNLSIWQVQAKAARIAAIKNDPESAHAAEDDLYIATLQAIAAGAPDAAEMAASALAANDPTRQRWYA